MTTITPALLAEIKALAQGVASIAPGDWSRGDGEQSKMVYCDDATGQRVAECDGAFLRFTDAQRESICDHIARMDPPTAIALVTALEDAQRDIAAAAKSYVLVIAERDALRAENERLRQALEQVGSIKSELPDRTEYVRGWNDAMFRVRKFARSARKEIAHD